MLHAVVMAGGAGTRFWPESRAARPKQLLRLVGDETMIQATVNRLTGLVAPDRLVITTTSQLAGAIRDQLPWLSDTAILEEPFRRDTAACIGLAAVTVRHKDPDATMIVMPSDHIIQSGEKFRSAIRHAAAIVEARPECLVTFGIRPTYPAESFGYIERGEMVSDAAVESPAIYQVAQFREKPDAKTAQSFLASGNFYWNSGIFVWKAGTILERLAEYRPKLFERLDQISTSVGTDIYDQTLNTAYHAIEPVSIDFAVMELAPDVVVVEAPFDWDDVGSWQAFARLHGVDENGNTIAASHVGINTRNTIVRDEEDHLIVTVGLEDCLIVHTENATLVANRHNEEEIRKVVKLLRERGMEDRL